ncbi:4-carboxymuconolactone decarboxylase [Frankia sp. Hr75.2]|nr:4-carboxymuconolactone decarboxylase [Frankia sp. Hr75.2]
MATGPGAEHPEPRDSSSAAQAQAQAQAQAPRLAPLPFEKWDDETRSILLRYLRRPELYLSGAPDAPPMPKALGLFAHHVQLSETFLAFTDLFAGEHATLDPRHRELLILRVAWRTRSGYEWAQHTRIGMQAGLTTEQLYAIPHGAEAEVWTPVERALLAATDQMIDQSRVGDDTWQLLASHFDAGQLLELSFVVGGYLCLAAVLNSVGLQPDPPTEPVDAPALPAERDPSA